MSGITVRSELIYFFIGVQDKVNITTESECKESPNKKGKEEIESKKTNNTLEKHLHNLNEILKCSNATPILKQGGIGYMCSFCPEQYPKPEDLKKHNLREHHGQTNLKIPCTSGNRRSLYRYSVRLDITGLSCALCDSNINSLEKFIVHIKQKHNRDIYLDINNHIVPFKFDTEQLTCCLCLNTFERFKILQEHMHKHYRNYVCDVCDAGFINQGSLNSHTQTHVKGTFACSFCNKIFDTVTKKKMHVRNSHTHRNMVNRCGYCHEGFREYYMKEQHLAKVHGVHNNVYKCNACDKTFSTPKKLRSHVKKDHLLERHHNCSICEMKFFRLHDLNEHMVKHSGDKKFQCEVCLKCYGRRKTLKEHMRIHNDDRRFKCEHCGKAFIQKCSWKAHMKNRHGQIMS
ncbi:unnamed protein product [Arctia plantaginis]|uniref:C2H2-type domain-containing protein n=1 Tax=Arctia plantaginis TaxID=874455 RepID=A0A8S1BTR8_ARCPL|nr:unnamed protein product [Arctia plantaginis]CAB3262400.1 unnamed protein product [Arctia plantaginis]